MTSLKEGSSAPSSLKHIDGSRLHVGPCRTVCVYVGAEDPGRQGSQGTCVGVTAANRQLPTD